MSAILSADDLNDFILPGVACIKPVEQLPTDELNENGAVDIQIGSDGKPLEISQIDGRQKELAPAQISLADCLACSGCITSAEEVLVAQHSYQEFTKQVAKADKVMVASVSHQTRASLALAYQTSVEIIDRRLIDLFVNQMGFSYVVGTGSARKMSLVTEAWNTIQQKELGNNNSDIAGDNDGSQKDKTLPLLSSICPGWVLYAEKTHPHILPRVSTVKSPQQITGYLLKTMLSREMNIPRNSIYHLSVMPCFDKKLESARKEEDEEVDVDCVLTPKELVNLVSECPEYTLERSTEEITSANNRLPDVMSSSIAEIYYKLAPKHWPMVDVSWSNDPGSLSGGYAYNYLRIYAMYLGHNPEEYQIATIAGKNSDVYEMRLIHDGKTVAASSVVNGFKNIQNLVRKFKEGSNKVNPLAGRRRARLGKLQSVETAEPSKTDYVEVMACPGGCINGGGQVGAEDATMQKEWLEMATNKYAEIPMAEIKGFSDLIEWIHAFLNEYGVAEERLLRTHFNAVSKPTDGTAALFEAKW